LKMWKERRRNSRLSGFFISPLFLSLVLLGLLAVIIFPLYKNMTNRYRIDREIEVLKSEIESMENGSNDLKKLLAYLESDQFAETEARLNFGMKKKGEEVVVIKEDETVAALGLAADVSMGDLPNPVKWLRYFFGR